MLKFYDLEQIEFALSVLSKAKFKKAQTAFKLHNVISKLEPVFLSYYKAKMELAKKYGQPNPNDSNLFDIFPEKKDEFLKEFTEFLQSEVDDREIENHIKKFTIEDFEDMLIEENGQYKPFEFTLDFARSIQKLIKDE